MTSFDRDRRKILKAGGAALTLGLAGCVGPFSDGEGVPGTTDPDPNTGNGNGNGNGNGSGSVPGEVQDYLSDAMNYDGSVEDMTGQSSVSIDVGAGNGLAFGPAAVRIDPGTTVTWEWTGQGGGHNVIDEDGAFDSGELVSEAGHTFEHTFEEDGIFLYFCDPHKGSGMKGAVIVGDAGGGGGSSIPSEVQDYLSDAMNYDGSVEDLTGQGSVTVDVGAGNGLAFGPAAVRIDPGTTVTWEWTGQGGGHNVIDEDGAFDSGELVSEAGNTFEHTFEEDGIFLYYCDPHKGSGMKGAVIVGDAGGGGGGSSIPSEVQDYLSDARNYEGSVEDLTGEGSVSVDVGAGQGLSFGPAAVRIDPGTTVTWEWTGQGGGHNVIDEDGAFDSGELVSEAGHTFEHTFEDEGVFLYYCDPHKGSGMKGAVIVGSSGGGGGGGGDEGGVPSDVQDYLSDAMNYEGSVEDLTGESSVTVDVGAGNGLAFGPAAIRIDSGTTVTWEWTGQGGGHNVIHEDGDFDSGELVSEDGHTFEHTFEGEGTFLYFCRPHKGAGMKGAVIVG